MKESRSPSPVTFAYEQWPTSFPGNQLTVTLFRYWSCLEPSDLRIQILAEGDKLHCDLYYNAQQFSVRQAYVLFSAFQILLRKSVEPLLLPVRTLPLLNEQDQACTHTRFQGPQWPVVFQGISRLFEEHVRNTPGRLAICSATEQFTGAIILSIARRSAIALTNAARASIALAPWNGSSLCLEDLFDVLKIVPAHLAALLRELPRKELLPCRALILGGEALPGSLVQQIRDLGADCEVYNHYGPTETTIGVLMHALLPMHSLPDVLAPHLPLGEPLTNTQVYVLDETMVRITPLLFLIPPGFTSITLFYAHTIMRR